MKLCIDCKHFKRNTGSRAAYEHECWAGISPVTGKQYPLEAEKVRANDKICGIEALRFEPKDDN